MKKKWNWIDGVIAVVLVGLVCVVGLKLVQRAGGEQATVNNDVEIVYTAEFTEIRGFTAENIKVGDTLYDVATGGCLGTITALDCRPYTTPEVGMDGQTVVAEKPDYFVVRVTVTGQCLEKSASYYLDDLVELKSGTTLAVNSKYVTSTILFDGIVSVGGEAIQ